MTNWNDLNVQDDRKKWDNWTMKPKKKSVPLTNYVSACVFTLASVLVMAGNIS